MEEKEVIKKLAEYCLNCKNKSCQKGCPLNNPIPEMITCIKEEKWQEAYDVISETTVLPILCGNICPHKKQCEGKCVRGIKGEPVQIGKIEAFLGRLAIENKITNKDFGEKKDKTVAVIGSGPAGLTAAAFLARKGYQVTIYEKEEKLGGLLTYGIPEFRLPQDKVEKCIELILNLGVNVQTGIEFGKQIKIEDLKKEYNAVFLAIGANCSKKMNIPGEELQNVYGANELLSNKNHPNYSNKKVAVIGGGNVAMDIARVTKRLGAKEVTVIYRRAESDMPAEIKEIEAAKSEEIKFLFNTNIIKVLGNESVKKIECVKTELVQNEEGTRLVPVNKYRV